MLTLALDPRERDEQEAAGEANGGDQVAELADAVDIRKFSEKSGRQPKVCTHEVRAPRWIAYTISLSTIESVRLKPVLFLCR